MAGVFAEKADEAVVQGKIDYMSGVTEAEIIAGGNKYTRQGWEALNSADSANLWAQNELIAIKDKTHSMDPTEYQAYLMQKRTEMLQDLPDDPAIRKVYVAAFEQIGPQLAAKQLEANNDYNHGRSVQAFSNLVSSGARSNTDASQVMPGTGLSVSPGIVSDVYTSSSERDRDVGIRTMLGEAGGEGAVGLAAVAHVLKNRTLDSRWGGSIADVALADNQFSAWNKGAGGVSVVHTVKTDSAAYQRAAAIYDAVMGGHSIDMTGGATHYYSPAGMDLLVKQGSQSNRVPNWLKEEQARSGGTIRIGGHVFVGKADGTTSIRLTKEDRDSQHPFE
ncbi:MAG: cell wall hydrolase, partial [Sneathiella sp.]